MAQFHSPVKLCPSSPKRSRNEVNWNKCIICQSSFCDSLVITMRNISKNSFIEALEARISGLIMYPAGLVRVLETHELNKF
jgi:hypothetical protein